MRIIEERGEYDACLKIMKNFKTDVTELVNLTC